MVETAQNDGYNQYQDCYLPVGGRVNRLQTMLRWGYPQFPWDRRRNSWQPWNPWWWDRWEPNDQKDEVGIAFGVLDCALFLV